MQDGGKDVPMEIPTTRPGDQDVAAVSVHSRLLPFWRELPKAWFIQFEAVVEPLKTSDDQKYRYVLQQLQPQDLQQITDILYKPPQSNKYETIKRRLLDVYQVSQVENFQKLIAGLELGDQKPSQLLRRMKELSGDFITDEGLRIEWLKQLPAQIRVVLSINNEATLETLAAMADQMCEYSSSSTIAAVTGTPSPLEVISKQLEKLTLEVAELRGRQRENNYPHLVRENNYPRNYRRRFRSRSSSRARRRAPVPGDDDYLCKYHFKFGDNAYKCESPCAWRKQSTKQEN